MPSKDRIAEAYANGYEAWELRHSGVNNPFEFYKHPELHQAWNEGRADARQDSERRHTSNAGDKDKTVERLAKRPKYD